jgi:hypothetical protein
MDSKHPPEMPWSLWSFNWKPYDFIWFFLGKSWDNKNQEVKNHKHKFHGFDETS